MSATFRFQPYTNTAGRAKHAIIAAMEITWLGHGTVQIVLPNGETLLLDPWTDGNPKFPAGFEIKRCDSMLISHGHFDHIHDAVPLAKKFNPEVVAIYETCQWLGSKGVERCLAMNKGGSQKAGSVTVSMTHAVHSCGITDDDGSIVYGGEAAGYVLTFQDGRVVYFAGDTNVFSDMALITELYKPQLAFLPIGDLFTMGPRGAAVACRLLEVPTVIPLHFGTFPQLTGRPEQLQQLVPGVKVQALTPGQPFHW